VQLQRSYADIDIVIGRKDGRAAKTALLELGYLPNERFNALRGDRRMLFYDTVNGRQLDVFVGTFDMCHKLDLSDRLTLLPGTLSIADLFLTKLFTAPMYACANSSTPPSSTAVTLSSWAATSPAR